MRRKAVIAAVALTLTLGALSAFQKPFRQYNGVEYSMGTLPMPPDWNQPAEFVFARLMYPNGGPMDGYYPRYQGDWHQGLSLWTQDYPRADRHFLEAVRRLTRIHTRSVEQPVDLDENEEFDLPFLYAVQVGEWALTEKQGREMREFLLRGGFFFADDFHGNAEYAEFVKRIRYVFPDRPIVEIPDDDPIVRTVYDLHDRIQIPGEAHLRTGCKNCEDGGRGSHWQAIYDDKGRVMIAIYYNDDIGDAWEWSDAAHYPENIASVAMRIGVNDIIYAMTH
ncbi:MAG TPA: DUF4159 domain-containing protein [Bryobacteraceae bacterium]|nr:DUF4159 domain-containing protein [Bryobacteraceae bacterium]